MEVLEEVYGIICFNGEKQPDFSCVAWIKRQCLMHGSTMEGRIAAFAYLTGRKQLVPVYVRPGLLLLPEDKERRRWINIWPKEKQEDCVLPAKLQIQVRMFVNRISG